MVTYVGVTAKQEEERRKGNHLKAFLSQTQTAGLKAEYYFIGQFFPLSIWETTEDKEHPFKFLAPSEIWLKRLEKLKGVDPEFINDKVSDFTALFGPHCFALHSLLKRYVMAINILSGDQETVERCLENRQIDWPLDAEDCMRLSEFTHKIQEAATRNEQKCELYIEDIPKILLPVDKGFSYTQNPTSCERAGICICQRSEKSNFAGSCMPFGPRLARKDADEILKANMEEMFSGIEFKDMLKDQLVPIDKAD